MKSRPSNNRILENLQSQQVHDVFNALVRSHSKLLYLRVRSIVGTHEDANDVMQDSLLKIWKGLPQFRGKSQLSTWAYQIASRTAIDFVRSRNRTHQLFMTETPALSEVAPGDAAGNYESGFQHFVQLIDSLPDQQRFVFIFKYFEGMTYEELHQHNGTSVGGLKANYHHAATTLKNKLSN